MVSLRSTQGNYHHHHRNAILTDYIASLVAGHTININLATDVISIILLTISWSYPSTELCYLLVRCSFLASTLSLVASLVKRSRINLALSLSIMWLIVTGPSGVMTILICVPIFIHLRSRHYHIIVPYLISLHIFYSSEHTTGLHGLQYNSSFVDGSDFR